MDSIYYKVMALDYGDVRIGIALSDLTRTIANGFENYTRTTLDKDISHIIDIVNTNNVKVIVVGLPVNMDGTESKQTEKTRNFVNLLSQKTSVKIEFVDERLTSMIAEKILIKADVSRAKRKNITDKLSATIILQDYLDKK